MIDAAGGGNRTGDGRVGDDELERDLRPAHAVNFGRPRRQRAARQTVEQRALLERPVGNDSDATLLRQRQQAPLDFAVDEVVGGCTKSIGWLAMMRSRSPRRRPCEVVMPT